MSAKSKKPEGLQTCLTVAHRAPLEEPACLVVDGVVELLVAAARGEYANPLFESACRKYGLLQYESDTPSDVGILNFLSPIVTASFHSRKHREAELTHKGELAYREEEALNREAIDKTAKKIELMDRISDRYKAGLSQGPIETGLFGVETKQEELY